VVAELAASPELAAGCFSGLDERHALRAVTVLGRAAADQGAAAGLLERLLPLVEQVVAGLPADLRLLTVISDAIPYPSMALAAADLAVTRRILDLARSLQVLARVLEDTGQADKADTARHELLR
jgi:hypothetical protein